MQATRTARRRRSTRAGPDGGAPDTPGWTVRVVPNLYPALGPGDPDGRGRTRWPRAAASPTLFASRPAIGGHEVIVNAPQAAGSLAELDPGQLEQAMDVWRERMRAHDGAAYVHVIVNEGREAGASLPHTHAQLYALPFVPARRSPASASASPPTPSARTGATCSRTCCRRRSGCASGSWTTTRRRWRSARSPRACRTSCRSSRARRARGSRTPGRWPRGMLHAALGRLERALGALPPLNLWVRTAPRGAQYFCWRIDVMPRLTHLAGLELGAGVHLNILPPERAAELLRAA